MQNDYNSSQIQYLSYGFPIYSIKNKEDSVESGYSTPLKNQYQSNKKTVYEVVV